MRSVSSTSESLTLESALEGIQFFLVVLMAFVASGLLIGVLALIGYALDAPLGDVQRAGIVEERIADHKKRWEYLFSINLWKPAK